MNRGDLARVSPLLIGSGAAALGWRRLQATPSLCNSPEANDLRQAGRILALADIHNNRAVEHVVALLNDAGIEPLIVKGWAVARFYATTYLRPYGDIDLCAPPRLQSLAKEVLRQHAVPRLGNPEAGDIFLDCGPAATICRIDLHENFSKAYMPAIETLCERSTRVEVGAAHARLLSTEDHLRYVITHFLRHGAWRPLWLCDVAAMVEALPANFDWTLCLSSERRVAGWIAATITLAQRLLDCRVSHIPQEVGCAELPSWFERTVLREWEAPYAGRLANIPALQIPRRSKDVVPWLQARWPNPIRAIVGVGEAFSNAPRLPYQIAHVAAGVRRYVAGLAA